MRGISAIAILVSGCAVALPEVPEDAFACVDDAPLADGSLPCPASHYCAAERCAPRLGCFEPDASRGGCDPKARRCELFVTEHVAAARCESGTHTSSSAFAPDDGTCPDGTFFTTRAPGGPPTALVVLPGPGSAAARLGAAGLGPDDPVHRICARACSTELDCDGHHTCRPAWVRGPASAQRATVGICYPDVLVRTGTRAAEGQVDPEVCASPRDCKLELGRAAGRCVAEVVGVPDHPEAPLGAAWGARTALVPRCTPDPGSSLQGPGGGCIRGTECRSGVCLGSAGGCARLCDPRIPDECGPNVRCNEIEIELPGAGETGVDRLFVCGRT